MTDPRTTDANPEPEIAATTGAAADDYEVDGEFDLDRYYEETRRDGYQFRWAGQSWTMPSVYDLPTSILDLVGADDLGAEQVRGALEAAFGDQWVEINRLKPLPISATFTLFGRWLKWSGVDPGEALSSAASSNGTAGQSKRTSRSSTTGSGSTGRSPARKRSATRRGNS